MYIENKGTEEGIFVALTGSVDEALVRIEAYDIAVAIQTKR